MKKYIQVVYIQKRSQNDTYFQIQYVHISISDESKPHFLRPFKDPGHPQDNTDTE